MSTYTVSCKVDANKEHLINLYSASPLDFSERSVHIVEYDVSRKDVILGTLLLPSF